MSDQASRPSKLLKMEDGSGTPFPAGNLNVFNTTGSGSSQVPGVGTLPHTANRTEMQTSDSQSQVNILICGYAFYFSCEARDLLITLLYITQFAFTLMYRLHQRWNLFCCSKY